MKSHRREKPEGVRLLRIGCDMDGVIQDFHDNWAGWMVHSGQLDPALIDATEHHSARSLSERYGITKEEFERHFEEGVEEGYIFSQGDPLPGSVETLNRLYYAGHGIHFVTARKVGTMFAHNTMDWLHKHGFMYDSVTFSHDKTIMDLDILIDDHERNFREMQAAFKNVVLMTQPWNTHIDTPARVSWGTLESYLVEHFGIEWPR